MKWLRTHREKRRDREDQPTTFYLDLELLRRKSLPYLLIWWDLWWIMLQNLLNSSESANRWDLEVGFAVEEFFGSGICVLFWWVLFLTNDRRLQGGICKF